MIFDFDVSYFVRDFNRRLPMQLPDFNTAELQTRGGAETASDCDYGDLQLRATTNESTGSSQLKIQSTTDRDKALGILKQFEAVERVTILPFHPLRIVEK